MGSDLRGGHQTYWTDMGQGPRRALMIHCSLAHSGAWRGLAGRLGDRLTMRAFDLPGHGKSGPWVPGRDMQDISVAMAVDLIGDDGPWDVIGHSFGATVALRLAAERPDLVRSVTMIESVLMAAAAADDAGYMARHGAAMQAYGEAVARGDHAAAARAFMAEWGDGRPWRALPEEQRAYFTENIHLIEASHDTILMDRYGFLDSGLIEALDVPVMLIRGSDSSALQAPVHRAIARRMPGIRDEVVAGAGHMVPLTHPREVAGLICEFLDGVPVEG